MPQTYNGPDAGRFYPVPNEGVSKRRFGTLTPPRVGRFVLDLSTARDRVRIKIAGTFLWACDGSSSSASAQIAFKEDNADPGVTFRNGTQVSGAEYAEIYVTNTAQAGATLTLIYLVEERGDGAFRVSNPGANNSTVLVQPNATLSTVADVAVAAAATSILAADTTRRAAYITNSGAFPMRVGDSNVAANRGVNVAVGASITITSTAQIFGFGVGGATTANVTFEVA